MKNNIIKFALLAFFLTIANVGINQNDTVFRKQTFRTWVISMDTRKTTKGVLYSLKDSSLVMLNYINDIPTQTHIEILNIDQIIIRKKGNIGRGMIIGGCTGLIVGLVVHFLTPKNNTAAQQGVIPVPFTFAGVGLGTLFGSMKKHFLVNGKQQKFNNCKTELNNYVKAFTK